MRNAMTLTPHYPVTRYKPPPLIDFSNKDVRRRLSPSAIRVFFNIMAKWGVRDQDAQSLLGGVSNRQFRQMKKDPQRTLNVDTLTRISYLVGIFKTLSVIF
jgi:hypothetical protein